MLVVLGVCVFRWERKQFPDSSRCFGSFLTVASLEMQIAKNLIGTPCVGFPLIGTLMLAL